MQSGLPVRTRPLRAMSVKELLSLVNCGESTVVQVSRRSQLSVFTAPAISDVNGGQSLC